MNTDTQKQKLLALKQEYEARIHKITDNLQHQNSQMKEHWDDQALVASQNDMRKNLLVEAEQNLQKVNHALSLLEQGDYGYCNDCGEAIEDGRLKAVPFATECIKHAD